MCSHGRKTVKTLVWILAILGLCLPVDANAGANSSDPTGKSFSRQTLDPLCGEKLSYDIAFLWFDRLAVGDFILEKTEQPQTYRATLEARTMGAAAWLTGNRVQRYVSTLRLSDEGGLRPVSFDADMYRRSGDKVKSRLKHWAFDYPRRLVIEKVTRNGRKSPLKRHAMGSGPYPYDILSAFYNFRAGLWGPLEVGTSCKVPTFAKGAPSVIDISVLANKDRPKEGGFPTGGLVVKVVVDPEVFDTGDGTLYIWFDKAMRPDRVLVKNVIGMGDVRANLRSAGKESGK
jgi:hypothetical protein